MTLNHIRAMVEMMSSTLQSSLDVPHRYADVSSIVISGMGGSAIAGDIIKDLTEDTLPKPISLCRKLTLPAYAKDDTLVISMSYSGNTVETISAFKEAVARKCKIVGVTGGGRLERLFAEENVPYMKLSSGYLPREAMPQMLATILGIFRDFGWIKRGFNLAELASRRKGIELNAQEVAQRLRGKDVIVYTKYPSVAHRFKSQLNENAKTFAKYDIIPELAHNEINSWGRLGSNFHIVFMRDTREPKVVTRMVEIMKKLLKDEQYTEVITKGSDMTNRLLYLIWFGDFVSYYLAVLSGVDPERVEATEFLKSQLARAGEVAYRTDSPNSKMSGPRMGRGPS